VVFVKHFYTVKTISGRSMQPTLNPEPLIWRDIALFERWSIQTGMKVQRGDVVALRSPTDPKDLLVKRVVAIAGDVVQTLKTYPSPEVAVTEGQVWVEGDEGFHTTDSNQWGPIPSALIDSKLVFVLWPWTRYGSFPAKRAAESAGASSDRRTGRPFEMDREKLRNSRVRSSAAPNSGSP